MPRIAVVGRPNVGKSTFINRLAGEDRMVVSPIPGTTRDAIDLPMKRNGRDFLLIDTAGLRRRTKVREQVEYYSTVRTRTSLERCDIAVVIADADEGITLQDVKILGDAAEMGKGALLAMNKWDLIDKDHKTAIVYARDIVGRFPSLRDFPDLFRFRAIRPARLEDSGVGARDLRQTAPANCDFGPEPVSRGSQRHTSATHPQGSGVEDVLLRSTRGRTAHGDFLYHQTGGRAGTLSAFSRTPLAGTFRSEGNTGTYLIQEKAMTCNEEDLLFHP